MITSKDPIAAVLSMLVCSLALLLVAAPGQAQTNYSMTGRLEQYCCNWPNGNRPPFIPPTPTLRRINDFPFAGGGGGLTIRHGFPGPVATAMGTTGGRITFATSAIKIQGNFVNFVPVFPGWREIATNVNFGNQPGTFMNGNQVGSAAYCVNAAANPNCTDPADGTFGGQPFNGLMSFKAGPNQFGGTLRLLGGTPGYLIRTAGGPSRVRKGSFAAPLSQIGGPFNEYKVQTNTARFWPASLVFDPGTPMGPVQFLGSATLSTTQMILFAGIPWGTGTIYAGRTGGTGAIPTQSISGMGTNMFVAGAGGNISLVAASISGIPASNAFPILIRLSLSLPEPGVIAALGSGVALLGLLGFRKHRAQRARA
jgi:hypothetical protein